MDASEPQSSKGATRRNQKVKLNKNYQEWNVETLRVCNGAQNIEYHSKLSNAFKDDCEVLLLEFAGNESYNFTKFAETWRKYNFTIILEGEENKECQIIFLENCFFQLKKYIIFSKNVYIQVGAVYMLYSLYYKQPKSDLIKIRWTYDEYSAVLKLVEQVQNVSKDCVYIFYKMKIMNAFLFVAETRRWGIEPKFAYEEKQLVDNIFGHDINFQAVKSKIFSNEFFGLKDIHAVYKEYQEGLEEYLNERPHYKAVSDFQTSTLVEDVKSNCEEFELSLINKGQSIKDQINNSNLKTLGDKRKAIKRKAFKMHNKV